MTAPPVLFGPLLLSQPGLRGFHFSSSKSHKALTMQEIPVRKLLLPFRIEHVTWGLKRHGEDTPTLSADPRRPMPTWWPLRREMTVPSPTHTVWVLSAHSQTTLTLLSLKTLPRGQVSVTCKSHCRASLDTRASSESSELTGVSPH